MKKKKLLIFSDCYIYGGSERLMSFLVNNDILNHSFDIKFAFRYTRIYRRGMALDYKHISSERIIPVALLSNETLFYQINCLPIPNLIKIILKFPFFIIEKLQVHRIWNLLMFLILLIKEKPDVLHINNGGYPAAKSCNLLVLANYLLKRTKSVYQVNNQASSPQAFQLISDRFIERNVSSFITASYLAKEKLITLRGFSESKIKVINNCIIPQPINIARSKICDELDLSEDAFLISQVAFLTKRKGQANLIKAISLLFQKSPNLKAKIFVMLIGDGEDKNKLMELTESFGLKENIYFLGFKQNSQDYISASDLFILPSISNEDMPLVILTALQLGVPVIASNFAGIAQAIKSEENGLLVELENDTFEQDLCESIHRLYEDGNLRERLSIAAKRSFDNFSPEKYGENLKMLYSNL